MYCTVLFQSGPKIWICSREIPEGQLFWTLCSGGMICPIALFCVLCGSDTSISDGILLTCTSSSLQNAKPRNGLGWMAPLCHNNDDVQFLRTVTCVIGGSRLTKESHQHFFFNHIAHRESAIINLNW